jgi:hypothetical protein
MQAPGFEVHRQRTDRSAATQTQPQQETIERTGWVPDETFDYLFDNTD